jgi:NCAIR mutase (PurE)-related protein
MPVAGSLQGNRIIEIAGIHGVDGDDHLVRQIQPIAQRRLIEPVGFTVGIFQSFLGKLDRQAVFKDDGQRVHARLAAGTADLPVAEEAIETLIALGSRVDRIADVGVAGIHRLVPRLPLLRRARVAVVVAGMEGALPSVVQGLLDRPVIAVPTSIGYGAHFRGLASLLAMLNACAAGITLVNIDNGFGAGYAAHLVNVTGGRSR